MSKLESQIIRAVRQERWAVSSHAADQLMERGMEIWQVIAVWAYDKLARVAKLVTVYFAE